MHSERDEHTAFPMESMATEDDGETLLWEMRDTYRGIDHNGTQNDVLKMKEPSVQLPGHTLGSKT
jgi:hypothetical protein